MYTLKEQSGEEVLFFAPEEVNEQIKTLKKGDRFEITKLAEQKGTKIVTKYEVKLNSRLQQTVITISRRKTTTSMQC
jgi:gas vesicle protein